MGPVLAPCRGSIIESPLNSCAYMRTNHCMDWACPARSFQVSFLQQSQYRGRSQLAMTGSLRSASWSLRLLGWSVCGIKSIWRDRFCTSGCSYQVCISASIYAIHSAQLSHLPLRAPNSAVYILLCLIYLPVLASSPFLSFRAMMSRHHRHRRAEGYILFPIFQSVELFVGRMQSGGRDGFEVSRCSPAA
ncbi:hypothetical protein ARMSODRAFT_104471 [Armillaria solidipes]|uniref:Uncharacterized protein n=1 Tax=Armillaria solidipes TaxID=1076256 RepID=A0A2H3ALN2_9AGAR|nr:hypothetical protein ARMSODRAFT_104471 [Armillaria solidipes]